MSSDEMTLHVDGHVVVGRHAVYHVVLPTCGTRVSRRYGEFVCLQHELKASARIGRAVWPPALPARGPYRRLDEPYLRGRAYSLDVWLRTVSSANAPLALCPPLLRFCGEGVERTRVGSATREQGQPSEPPIAEQTRCVSTPGASQARAENRTLRGLRGGARAVAGGLVVALAAVALLELRAALLALLCGTIGLLSAAPQLRVAASVGEGCSAPAHGGGADLSDQRASDEVAVPPDEPSPPPPSHVHGGASAEWAGALAGGTHARRAGSEDGGSEGGCGREDGGSEGGCGELPALAALRASGECLWAGVGGGLPATLSERAYLRALLSKPGKDPRWCVEKLAAAVALRRSAAAAADDDGGVAGACACLSGSEPLVTDERLAEAGWVLRAGCLYFWGRTRQGWPVLWCRSGLMDLSRLGAPGQPTAAAWGRAIATMVELMLLEDCKSHSAAASAGRAGACDEGGARRFAYVECPSGMTSRTAPIGNSLRVARETLTAVFNGFPERLADVNIGPVTPLTRVLLAMARPLIPASIRKRGPRAHTHTPSPPAARLLLPALCPARPSPSRSHRSPSHARAARRSLAQYTCTPARAWSRRSRACSRPRPTCQTSSKAASHTTSCRVRRGATST